MVSSSETPSVSPPILSEPTPATQPPAEPTASGDMLEYTKDGNVSRMRAHAGNVPSLPQTKLCPLCPAKFTRTTHLNRHLRTHSNERLHVCDKCQSQFTRSDLLARHKRNCGDSTNAHRSRRKSCQACADSKIKCDQKQPCSKCQSRGRECVYRSAKSTGTVAKASRRNPPDVCSGSSKPSPADRSTTPEIITVNCPEADFFDVSFPKLCVSDSSTSSPDIGYNSFPNSAAPLSTEKSPSPESNPSTSYASSYISTTATDATEGGSRVNFAQEALDVQNQLNALFSNEMFDKFFSNVFVGDTQQPFGATNFLIPQVAPVLPTPNATSQLFPSDPDFSFSTGGTEEQPFMAAVDPYSLDAFPNIVPGGVTTQPADEISGSSHLLRTPPTPLLTTPLPSELEYYLHIFFTKFLEQMPIVHAPTFNVSNKPAILVNAMQACGALYVKTTTASNFITQTLASMRDEIMAAFARKPTVLEDQIHLILAVCLLQTIGLFHERAEQRSQSNIYHAMLVMMIRQSGLLNNNANWSRPILDNPSFVQQTWRDWVCYETTKRALTLTFLHDCCHSLYFTLPPTFFRQEFNLHLPCDDILWSAPTSHDWLMELMKTSSRGTPEVRLCGGPCVQDCLTRLSEVGRDARSQLVLNPFSQFVLIHGILRKLFEDCLDRKRQDSRPSVAGEEYTRVNPTIQYMLHNWLQTWLQSPDTLHISKGHEPVFFHDGLPFYWIAQVLLLAYQENLPPFASDNPAWNLSEDAKFGLMKEWFKHVRTFLRRGEQGPTLFWDELMKIRMDSWQSDIAAPDQHDGLLGFFEKH